MLIEVPMIKQEKEYCGAACLGMVFKYYKKNISQYVIASNIYKRGLGISAKDMKRFSEKSGFKTYVFKGNINIITYFLKRKLPLISAVSGFRDIFHYVTIIGFDNQKKEFIINDPSSGKREALKFSSYLKNSKKTNHWTLLIIPEKS